MASLFLSALNFSETKQPLLINDISPLASSMFAPGVEDVMKEFGSSSSMLASFVVSVYVLGYMVGPFLIAPLSELYGRVPLYHACNVLFFIFTIACAVAQSLPQLIVFRLLAGVAGVCPLTIGSGTAGEFLMSWPFLTLGFQLSNLSSPTWLPKKNGLASWRFGPWGLFWGQLSDLWPADF
jgi:MFS family permease